MGGLAHQRCCHIFHICRKVETICESKAGKYGENTQGVFSKLEKSEEVVLRKPHKSGITVWYGHV